MLSSSEPGAQRRESYKRTAGRKDTPWANSKERTNNWWLLLSHRFTLLNIDITQGTNTTKHRHSQPSFLERSHTGTNDRVAGIPARNSSHLQGRKGGEHTTSVQTLKPCSG